MSSNPFEPPQQSSDGMTPGVDVRSMVSGPAIGLLIGGILNLLAAIYGAINGAFTLFMGDKMLQNNPAFQQMQEQNGPEMPDMQMAMQVSGGLYLAGGVIGVIVAAFIIRGALNMKNLKNHGSAMLAAILSVIPGLSCCCIVSIPLGIWALVVLNKPEVRSAFE